MPLRIFLFCCIFVIGIVSVWVCQWGFLRLLWREAPEFVSRYGLPRKEFDLGAHPGAVFGVILFRRYREVEDIRVRRLGDLLFVLYLVCFMGALAFLLVPESAWLG